MQTPRKSFATCLLICCMYYFPVDCKSLLESPPGRTNVENPEKALEDWKSLVSALVMDNNMGDLKIYPMFPPAKSS